MGKNSFLQALWQQNKLQLILLIILVVVVVAASLGRQLIVEPRLQSLSTEQFRLQQFVRQRQVEFANSGIPVSTAAQLEKNLQKFMTLVPSEVEFSHFIGDLFRWAGDADLEITQVSYQPEMDKETGFLRYGLSFSVKGHYGKVKKLIHLLERSERILLVDKITLSGAGGKKDRDSVNLNIALTTYFQRESS